MRWYVLYTRPNHERAVYERLLAKRFQAYVPLVTTWRRSKSRLQKVVKSLCPRHVFIGCHLEMHTYIELICTPGVMRLREDDQGQFLVVSETELKLCRELDVLEVSVPAMEELKSCVVRVAGDGMIALPLVGTMRAAGLTEEGLREALRHRLQDYMHNPQIDLFVRENRSQQVAVLGAVAKPGLYNLASGADTILDMIGLAGGMKEEAPPWILFIPAEPAENEKAREFVSTLPVQLISQDPSPLVLRRTDPISIELKNFASGTHQIFLTLPARPGDVIVVPGSGAVLVQGWVEKPGSYKITLGLTVLGAIAAAGGPLFAVDTGVVSVIGTGKDGGKILLADLEKIKRGERSDVPVQEGDVIDVAASTAKLVPYGVYRFFSSVFHIGAGASIR
jgi:polysaccharide export outer membrane protein